MIPNTRLLVVEPIMDVRWISASCEATLISSICKKKYYFHKKYHKTLKRRCETYWNIQCNIECYAPTLINFALAPVQRSSLLVCPLYLDSVQSTTCLLVLLRERKNHGDAEHHVMSAAEFERRMQHPLGKVAMLHSPRHTLASHRLWLATSCELNGPICLGLGCIACIACMADPGNWCPFSACYWV